MQNRVIIHLLPEERAALQRMADEDVRPPNETIRFLLINEAVKRGLLNAIKANTGAIRQDMHAGVAA